MFISLLIPLSQNIQWSSAPKNTQGELEGQMPALIKLFQISINKQKIYTAWVLMPEEILTVVTLQDCLNL